MKKISVIMAISILALSVNAQKGKVFGEKLKTRNSISVEAFKQALDGSENWSGVVSGTVKQVCKSEGCWLRLDDGSKDGILVKMKDHNFTVPKDIDGKKVFVKGMAQKSTTTVEQLRHYAEDAGKTAAEISTITAPKVEIKMDALGVIVM